jgi:hypothetical protein
MRRPQQHVFLAAAASDWSASPPSSSTLAHRLSGVLLQRRGKALARSAQASAALATLARRQWPPLSSPSPWSEQQLMSASTRRTFAAASFNRPALGSSPRAGQPHTRHINTRLGASSSRMRIAQRRR